MIKYKLLKSENIEEISNFLLNTNLYNYLSIKDIKNDLNLVIDKKVKFSLEKTYRLILSYTTDNIILKNIDLGKFRILIYIYNTHYRINVKAITPIYCLINEEVVHPHILGNHLCMGEYESLVYNLLNKFKLDEVFLIINEIIHNYDADSSYAKLSDWFGYVCENCLGNSEQRVSNCVNCMTDSCIGCSKLCIYCSTRHHYSCFKICGECNKEYCPTYGICNNCNKVCYRCKRNLAEIEGICNSCNFPF